jgi:hypothetical protein
MMQANVKVNATISPCLRQSVSNNVQKDLLTLTMTSQIALKIKTTPAIRTLTVPAKQLVHILQQLFLILRMTLGPTAVSAATRLRRNSTPPQLNDGAQRPLAIAILLQAAVIVTIATTTMTTTPIKTATKAHGMPSSVGRLSPTTIHPQSES